MAAPCPDTEPNIARHEAVSTVYSRLPGTLIVSFINALLIVIVVEDGGFSPGYLVWLVGIALVSLARGASFLRFRADARRSEHIRAWVRRSIFGAFCSGLLWGVGPVLPFAPVAGSQWLWAFAIGGMCAGAASLHAAHLPTALAFMIPASVPLATSLVLKGTLPSVAAAIMTIAFIALTTFTAILFSRDFGRLQSLQSALGMRAEQLDDANRRLSREIAEHRETSEALHQAQKMEALGNLTGGFAHDFNNILTVIISNLEVMKLKSSAETTHSLANAAITAAESGADLISRLLAFARKRTLNAQCCNVIEVIEEFRALLVHAVSGNISIAFDLPAGPVLANIDAAQFQAMLLNLVVNARDAMAGGGVITIAVATVSLDQRALNGTSAVPGDFVAISVTDTGHGMSAETLERAFEPFFTTKEGRGGTGLGLAQVYGFARQSGGLGRIESRVGEGTSVTIFLPLVTAGHPVAVVAEKVEEAPAAAPSLSILLVDDNEAVLSALSMGLSDEDWTIACLGDARSAIEAVERGERYDLVITDVDMPGEMNGYRLATELRSRFGLPVLLMSGVPASVEAEWSDFPMIAKPFRKQALMEKIQTVIDRKG